MTASGNTLQEIWRTDPRWQGIVRPYSAGDVERLRGTLRVEYTFARAGAERLWKLLHSEDFLPALGAMTGNQAIEQVSAGLPAIYVSGWQIAADANSSGEMYPDQGLYGPDSVPRIVRNINRALQRADQIDHSEGRNGTHWFAPLIADGDAGFGGMLNAFELMKAMIDAGAAAVHFEDQLSSAKRCGHLGGKVLVPVDEFIGKLVAARLAADVLDVPTVLIARTDSNGATLIRNLASYGIEFDAGFLNTLTAAYVRMAQDAVARYHDAAALNGIAFDRHEEELAVETFSGALRRTWSSTERDCA